ncbi:hypothetical protein BJ878DRAFT_500016 [Calycina marina]|uniref:Uncharacterized protein n=1 Tax=Calycina marina TaxID=1763456 RepID=A0A9P8CGG0_9HELO|nr:hypothetical protein BJ878DRAFT_500016 [Calycina marina]
MDPYLSSPDPLNDSSTYHSPVKARRVSRARYSLPLESSPTKQTFELDVGSAISSQKLRVTVEAGSPGLGDIYEDGRYASPSPAWRVSKPASHRQETATTMTVPVKGLSDSDAEEDALTTPKKAKGRPRRSGTPVPGNKRGRAGTPSQKKRRSVGTLVDGDDSQDMNFHLGHGVEVGRRKGRTRSKLANEPFSEAVTESEEELTAHKHLSKPPGRRSRTRRKSATDPAALEPEENAEMQADDDGFEAIIPDTSPPTASASPPSLDQPTRSSRRVSFQSPPLSSPTHEGRMRSQDQEEQEHEVGGFASPEYSDHNPDEEETVDDADQHQDFDTIMESEGFSMISVDSVPSYRGHVGSPAHHEMPNGTITPLRPKSILDLQSIEASRGEDSFSSIPESLIDALTPAPKAQNLRPLSVQNSRIDDSFSIIPSGLLESLTPARHSLEKSIRPTTGESLLELQQEHDQQNEANDRTPQTVSATLDAVVPSVRRNSGGASGSVKASGEKNPSPTLNQESQQDSGALQLLTPDDTPSPKYETFPGQCTTRETEPINGQPGTVVSHDKTQNTSTLSYMKSSPPVVASRRYTYTAHLKHRRELQPYGTETPSIVFSSPALPPPIQFVNGHPILGSRLHQGQQPKLSSTVRAGQLLQGIVVPALSHRGRAHSLGSPFKSPIADGKISSSAVLDIATSPSQERGVRRLPRLDLAGDLFSQSLSKNQSNQSHSQDDPFSRHDPPEQRSPSLEENLTYTLGLPGKRSLTHSRLSAIMSGGLSQRSDDAMSWQAEDGIEVNAARTSLINDVNTSNNPGPSLGGVEAGQASAYGASGTMEETWAAAHTAVSRQVKEANTSKVIVINSDDEQEDEPSIEDNLLLETINSSPMQDNSARINVAEKPLRGKLPSPWRKNSERLVYSDELSQLKASPKANPNAKAKENTLAKDAVDESADLDLSEYPIPQKAAFNAIMRTKTKAEIKQLLASSPGRPPLPVLPRSSPGEEPFAAMVRTFLPSTEVRRTQEHLVNIPQKAGFAPRIQRRPSNGFEASLISSPAKSGLKSGSNFDACPGNTPKVHSPPTPKPASSSSGSQPLKEVSPRRTNPSKLQIQRPPPEPAASDESSQADESSSMISDDEESINRRTVKWTETALFTSTQKTSYVSPTKPCLRSLVKTPRAGSADSQSPVKSVAWVSSSPIPLSPINEPFSATTWTRNHWVLLHSIVNTHKPENQASEQRRRKNDTRVISKLLGKWVSSKGEKMKLEQWHLEAVDQFRGEVPGWDEGIIAMRVFSILIGEVYRAKMADEMPI